MQKPNANVIPKSNYHGEVTKVLCLKGSTSAHSRNEPTHQTCAYFERSHRQSNLRLCSHSVVSSYLIFISCHRAASDMNTILNSIL